VIFLVHNFEIRYIEIYPHDRLGYGVLLNNTAAFTLGVISQSNAAYHNLDHTVLATLTAQELLVGKCLEGEVISTEDWIHYLLALLCHDIGFIRGACRHDQLHVCNYSTGIDDQMVRFDCRHTDACLSPYHVDRSKRFVAEQFQNNPLLDIDRIQQFIEFTRFPVPQNIFCQDTVCYGGMTRAADLIGQLSDPNYLDKLPDLFAEFEETGFNQVVGYQNPDDMRRAYPGFYYNVVLPYIEPSFVYLVSHSQGQFILDQLHRNVQIAEGILLK
jgi:hypothetical protein